MISILDYAEEDKCIYLTTLGRKSSNKTRSGVIPRVQLASSSIKAKPDDLEGSWRKQAARYKAGFSVGDDLSCVVHSIGCECDPIPPDKRESDVQQTYIRRGCHSWRAWRLCNLPVHAIWCSAPPGSNPPSNARLNDFRAWSNKKNEKVSQLKRYYMAAKMATQSWPLNNRQAFPTPTPFWDPRVCLQ